MFQHTAARRRLPKYRKSHVAPPFKFQHTAARRRLRYSNHLCKSIHCFNTQPPEGGCKADLATVIALASVTTHSRPKAAAQAYGIMADKMMFQHTAARRRLLSSVISSLRLIAVSTHSRPKAAAGGKIKKSSKA